MPLRVETSIDEETWRQLGDDLRHLDEPGSLIAFNDDGDEEVYMFGVDIGDSRAQIVHTAVATCTDSEDGEATMVNAPMGFDLVASLELGEQYTMRVRPVRGAGKLAIRFSHITEA